MLRTDSSGNSRTAAARGFVRTDVRVGTYDMYRYVCVLTEALLDQIPRKKLQPRLPSSEDHSSEAKAAAQRDRHHRAFDGHLVRF